MTRSDSNRSDHITINDMVVSGGASDDDYRGSGYDRGHLVSAGDLAFPATLKIIL